MATEFAFPKISQGDTISSEFSVLVPSFLFHETVMDVGWMHCGNVEQVYKLQPLLDDSVLYLR